MHTFQRELVLQLYESASLPKTTSTTTIDATSFKLSTRMPCLIMTPPLRTPAKYVETSSRLGCPLNPTHGRQWNVAYQIYEE